MKKSSLSIISIVLIISVVLVGCNNKSKSSSDSSSKDNSQSSENSSQAGESKYPDYLNLDSAFPIVKNGKDVTLKISTVYNSSLGGKTEDIWF